MFDIFLHVALVVCAFVTERAEPEPDKPASSSHQQDTTVGDGPRSCESVNPLGSLIPAEPRLMDEKPKLLLLHSWSVLPLYLQTGHAARIYVISKHTLCRDPGQHDVNASSATTTYIGTRLSGD